MTFILAIIGYVLSVFVALVSGITIGMKRCAKAMERNGWKIEPPEV